MINSVVIMGRLTFDPELRTTPTGVSVVRFQVACDRNYQKSGEERKADFIDVTAWRQTAEFISRYFRKGSMIAVEGLFKQTVIQIITEIRENLLPLWQTTFLSAAQKQKAALIQIPFTASRHRAMPRQATAILKRLLTTMTIYHFNLRRNRHGI